MTTKTVFILSTGCHNGRALTSTECVRLRAAGYSCSPAWVVDNNGWLYRPGASGGHDGIGVRAELS